jgi:hypothetical protein
MPAPEERFLAPNTLTPLPFRWHFQPVEQERDRSVQWQWHVFCQAGKLIMSSDRTFETLTECIDDAKRHGYGASL